MRRLTRRFLVNAMLVKYIQLTAKCQRGRRCHRQMFTKSMGHLSVTLANHLTFVKRRVSLRAAQVHSSSFLLRAASPSPKSSAISMGRELHRASSVARELKIVIISLPKPALI